MKRDKKRWKAKICCINGLYFGMERGVCTIFFSWHDSWFIKVCNIWIFWPSNPTFQIFHPRKNSWSGDENQIFFTWLPYPLCIYLYIYIYIKLKNIHKIVIFRLFTNLLRTNLNKKCKIVYVIRIVIKWKEQ